MSLLRARTRAAIPFALVPALLAGPLVVLAAADPVQAAAPAASVSLAPATADAPLLGERTTVRVGFSNPSETGVVGYGPRVDLFLDATGADGDDPLEPDDGVTFVSASYLGQPVAATTYTIPQLEPGAHEDGSFPHPVTHAPTPIPAGFVRGDQLVVLSLPFGSFTPGQPTVDVDVTLQVSELADAGADLAVAAAPWYRFGTLTALDDPLADPPSATYGTTATATLRPQLYRLSQRYLGPEGETATGAGYEREYEVSLDVADGQTITDVDLTQSFESEIVLDGAGPTSVSPAGGTATVAPGSITVHWDGVTGTASGADASFRYRYHVGRDDDPTGTTPVLDPATGASRSTIATATARNLWLATDSRDNTEVPGDCEPADEDDDPATPDTCTPPPPTYLPTEVEVGPQTSTFAERSLAVQKTADHDEVTPGTRVAWTAAVQVSDYFALGDLAFDDVVGDGLEVDPASFTISWPGQPAVPILPEELTVDAHGGTDGATPVHVDVSAVLARLVAQTDPFATGGFAIGREVATVEQGPAEFSIGYATDVAASYTALPAEGHRAISPADAFPNDATATGRIATVVEVARDPECAEPAEEGEDDASPCPEPHGVQPYLSAEDGALVHDGSHDAVRIPQGSLEQSVYARNGEVGVPAGTRFAPGDLITYRIRQTLPVKSYESLELTDYFPLPIQRAGSLPTGSAAIGSVADGAVPAAWGIAWGPANTLDEGSWYSVSANGAANSLTVDFGTRDLVDQSGGVVIDLLVTVPISDDPFADGLLLTNQARSEQTDSFTDAMASTALAQFVLAEPALAVYKGVLATSDAAVTIDPPLPSALAVTAPGGSAPRWDALAYPFTSASLAEGEYPLGSSARDVQAGDVVTYAVVVENSGESPNGAFDVRIQDEKSDFLVEPSGPAGYNLQVRYGDGSPAAYTGSAADLFAGGITLVDPEGGDGPTGAIPAAAEDGSNVVVLTYDLQVAPEADSQGLGLLTRLGNTAVVGGWSGVDGGPAFAPVQDEGEITLATRGVTVEKAYLGAEQSSTASRQVRVGEHVRYRITVEVPAGRHDGFVIEDELGAGLGLLSVDRVELAGQPLAPTLDGATGSHLTWDFGTLVNDTGDVADLVVEYTAELRDLATVDDGDAVPNDAWAGDYPSIADPVERAAERDAGHAAAPSLTVVEPRLTVSLGSNAARPDAGDPVTWTATARNDSGRDAYGAVLRIPVPAGVSAPDSLTLIGVSASSLTTIPDGSGGLVVQAVIPVVPSGAVAKLSAVTRMGSAIGSGSITATATLTWTSVPEDADHPEARTGSGDPVQDDYRATASTTVSLSGGAIDKSLVSTTYSGTPGADLAIGETARFTLDVLLPEGDLGAFRVTDVLPAGMSYLPGSLDVSAPGFGADGPNPELSAPDVTFAPATRTLTIAFGAVSLPGDNDASSDHALVSYDAALNDDTAAFPASSDTKSVQNSATLVIPGVTSATDAVSLRYVQPSWSLSNAVTSSPARPNDAVSFTLKATNTGAVGAKDAALTFTIPNAYATGAAQTVDPASVTCPVVAHFTCAAAQSGADLVLTFTPDDDARFPGGGTTGSPEFATTVVATLAPGRTAGSSFSARLAASAVSTSTTPADFTGGALPTVAPRAITASATQTVTTRIPDVGVAVTRSPAAANVAPGTEITWTVTPSVGSIRTENVRVWAVLSEHQVLVAGSVSNGGSYDAATRTVSWPVVASLGTGAGPARTFRTTVVDPAPVAPITVSVTGHATNQVYVDGASTGGYAHGADPNETGAGEGGNNVATATAGVNASPDLLPTISDGLSGGEVVAPGGDLTWTVAVRNVGNRDTESGSVSVTLPPGVTLQSQSAEWTVTGDGAPGTVLTWSGIRLDGVADGVADSTGPATITVRVDDAIRAGQYTIDGAAVTADPADANPANDRATDPTPLGGSPVLAIDKTLVTATPLTPGSSATWSLVIGNTGDRGAQGVVLVDELPAAVDPSTVVVAQLQGPASAAPALVGRTLEWSGGVLEAGDTVVYQVTGSLTSPAAAGAAGETVANRATLREDGRNGVADPAPDYPLVATTTDPLVATPDVAIAVTNGVSRLEPGTDYTYVVTATNSGTQSEVGDEMRLRIPAGMTVRSPDGGTLTGSGDDRVITWTGVDLAGGGGTAVRIVVLAVDGPQPAGETHKAVIAEIDPGPEDPSADDDTATDDDPLGGAPVLTIAKTADVEEPEPGDTVVYTLTAINGGSRGASGVVIADELPEGVTVVSISDDGVLHDRDIVWPARTLPGGGGTAVVTVTVTVDAPAAAGREGLHNVGIVYDDGTNTGTGDADPVRRASTGLDLPLVAAPDYRVALDVDAASAAPGDVLRYDLDVDNLGGQDGAGGRVVVTLPPGVSVADAGGADASEPGRLVFDGLDLHGATGSAVGGLAGLGFSLRVDAPLAAGIAGIPVSATVSVAGDVNAGNDEDDVATSLTGGPNLVVEKTATASASPGAAVIWTITVTNTGSRGASDVVLHDELPAGVGSVSPLESRRQRDGVWQGVPLGRISGSTVELSPGTVEVGDRYVYTIKGFVETAAAGRESIVNTVSFDAIGDADGENTSTPEQLASSATTAIDARPDLSISIDDARDELLIGTDASSAYTITVSNLGNQDTATGEVEVVLPAWLTPTSHTGIPVEGGTLVRLTGLTVAVGTPTVLVIPVSVPAWVAAGVEVAHATASVDNGATGGIPNEDGTTGAKAAADDTDVIAAPELVVTGSRTGSGAAGSATSWGFEVVNVGTQGATGVEFAATLPVGLVAGITAPDGTSTSRSVSDLVVSWPAFALDPGDPAVALTLPTTLVPSFPAGLTGYRVSGHAADDGANGPEADLANNTAVLDVSVADAPDMRVVNDPGALTAAPGEEIEVDLVVTNQGGRDTDSAVLRATIPAGLSLVPSAHDADGRVVNPDGTVEWSGLSVAGASAETLTRTLVLRVDDPQPAGRAALAIESTVTTIDDTVTDTADKRDETVVTLAGAPDLRIVQRVDRESAVAGDTVTWTVEIDDIGSRGATGVIATMTVPDAIDPATLEIDGGAWDPDARTITWTIPVLEVGPVVVREVHGALLDPVPLTGWRMDSAVQVGDDGTNGADPDLSNNADATSVVTGADLRVTKTPDSWRAVRGQHVSWEIAVENLGPATVTDLRVDEHLPVGLDGVRMTPDSGDYDAETGEWSGLDLAPGDTVRLVVTATVRADAPGGRLVNTVDVTPTGLNPIELETLSATADVPLMSPLIATGLDLAPWLLLALLLLAVGALLVRRRRSRGRHAA